MLSVCEDEIKVKVKGSVSISSMSVTVEHTDPNVESSRRHEWLYHSMYQPTLRNGMFFGTSRLSFRIVYDEHNTSSCRTCPCDAAK